MLAPRSIAAVGGRWAEAALVQCRELGFDGELWAVSRSRDTLAGRPCARSVDDLPAAPDASFVGVGREATVDVVRALAARGGGGAVCFASGFAESGETGAALQRALVRAAGPMPLLGPNCYGFLNYLDGVALWPDVHGGERCERGVAIVVQSSNVALNLSMQRRGLPIGYLVGVGNQASVGLSSLVAALAADPRVSAIGLHVEGLDDAAAFARASAAARARDVAVVALKTGRGEHAASVTRTHTAAIAGEDAAFDALLRRLGVPRLRSLEELLESLSLLHAGGPLRGRTVVSLSCSGGEAALIADAAMQRAVCLRPFSAAQRERIAATVHPLVTVANPFDYHTFDWGDPARLRATFEAVLGCGFDLAVLVLDLPRGDRCDASPWRNALDAFADAAESAGARAAVLATIAEGMPETTARAVTERGVATLRGIEHGLAAIEAAAAAGDAPATHLAPLARDTRPLTPRAGTVGEWAAKRLLAAHGISVPEGRLCHRQADALAAAHELGYPLVMKSADPDLLHKTESGAVVLAIEDVAGVRDAWRRLAVLGAPVIVERMVTGVVAELLLGVACDPVAGPFLAIASGGIDAELLGDRVLVPLPADARELHRALRRLRCYPRLNGYRGRPRADLDAAVSAALALQAIWLARGRGLAAVEINPLLLLPDGDGAIAADAALQPQR